MTITQIDGVPVPHVIHEAARQQAIRSGQTQCIGVEYHGERGEAFHENWPLGTQCKWLLGYTRHELLEQHYPVGIIHVSPKSERVEP